MINYIILSLILAAMFLSIVSAAAEIIFRRNSKIGKFFRYFRIRLRELSPFNFCVTAVLLLLWGLIFNDDSSGIFAAVLALFIILFTLHTEDFINLAKHRKKAALCNFSAASKPAAVMTTETPVVKELPLLPAAETTDEKNTDTERENN